MAIEELVMLVNLVDMLAALKAEGKMTMQRSSAGWRVALGHGSVASQPIYSQLEDALRALIFEQTIVTGP